ncbi:MAG: hypothetical protein ABJC04_10565, partial [Verrucomicrobiota bacterium]
MQRFVLLLFSGIFLSVLTSISHAAPRLVFVTGDHEYGSEKTMPALAKELEKKFGLKTTVLYATNEKGEHDESYEKNIP